MVVVDRNIVEEHFLTVMCFADMAPDSMEENAKEEEEGEKEEEEEEDSDGILADSEENDR